MTDFLEKYPLICLSAFNSEIITFPIDSTKTRMQINSKSNFFKLLIKHIKNKTIYNGIQYSLLRQFIYSGSRLYTYENIKKLFKKDTVLTKGVSALLAGGLGQIIASPLDLKKIKSINQNNQKTNLFKGVVPNVLRASTNSIGYLATYDYVKNNLLKLTNRDDYLTYSLSSIASGLSSTILCTPFDNMKSKIMGSNQYNGLFDCFYKTVKKNGVRSLYVGFIPAWCRSGPWHFIFWNSYEYYSTLFGYKSI